VDLRRRRPDGALIAAEGREDALRPGEIGRVVIARRHQLRSADLRQPGRGRLELRHLAEAGQIAGHHNQVEGAGVEQRRGRRHSAGVLAAEMNVGQVRQADGHRPGASFGIARMRAIFGL
jgi:hypothetical protein